MSAVTTPEPKIKIPGSDLLKSTSRFKRASCVEKAEKNYHLPTTRFSDKRLSEELRE